MYAAKTAAAAAANFHHSPTSTDGSSQGSHPFLHHFSVVRCYDAMRYDTSNMRSETDGESGQSNQTKNVQNSMKEEINKHEKSSPV